MVGNTFRHAICFMMRSEEVVTLRQFKWLLILLMMFAAIAVAVYGWGPGLAPAALLMAIAALALAISRAWQRDTGSLKILCQSSALTATSIGAGKVEQSDVWLEISLRNASSQPIEIRQLVVELSSQLRDSLGSSGRSIRMLPQEVGRPDMALPITMNGHAETAFVVVAHFDAATIDAQLQKSMVSRWKPLEQASLILAYSQNGIARKGGVSINIATSDFMTRVRSLTER